MTSFSDACQPGREIHRGKQIRVGFRLGLMLKTDFLHSNKEDDRFSSARTFPEDNRAKLREDITWST
jgi:hypothetical protein